MSQQEFTQYDSKILTIMYLFFGFGESIYIGATESFSQYADPNCEKAVEFLRELINNKTLFADFITSRINITHEEALAYRKRILKGKEFRGRPLKFIAWNEKSKKWDIELPYEETYKHWIDNKCYHSYIVVFNEFERINDNCLPDFWNDDANFVHIPKLKETYAITNKPSFNGLYVSFNGKNHLAWEVELLETLS